MRTSKLVMVVDDDEALRESICELLEEDGFRTVWADSGTTALGKLRASRERPDVILLDLMMPEMNGWQFRESQLRDPALASIPVVIMTARRDLQRIKADAVVHKPLKLSRLLEVVGRFTRESDKGDEDPRAAAREAEAARAPDSRPPPAAADLGRIVSRMQAGLVQTDLSGHVALVNARYREITGRSEPELLGLRVTDVTHPEDRGRARALFETLVERGTPYTAEERCLRPDGTVVWVETHASRIDGADGRPSGVVLVVIDATPRKQSERVLRESEERFRFIFETAEVSLWDQDLGQVKDRLARLRDRHGAALAQHLEATPALVDELLALVRIRDVNPATLRMFGATTKEQLFGALGSVSLPESRRAYAHLLAAAAEGRTSFAAESVAQTLAGRRFEVFLAAGFAGGDRALVSITDVSSIRATDRGRHQTAAEAERAVRFSETFVGVLGHDLRNPLSAITTAASLLEVRADSEKIAKPVARILVSADRLERMVSQLLDFTRVRLGRGIPMNRESIDLEEVTRAIVDELEPMHKRRIQVQALGDLVGTWDSERLSQLLTNLATNACQHGAPGMPVIIRLDGTSRSSMRIEVRNRGVIAPEVLPVVFEPLRLGRTERRTERTERSSGLGLGLYITRQIALAHGGDVRVDSNDDDGTCFTVDLPRRPPAEDEAAPTVVETHR